MCCAAGQSQRKSAAVAAGGWALDALLRCMERSTRYLNNLEHDRSEPRFTTILLLAEAIGMEQGELVNATAELRWGALAEDGPARGVPAA